MTLSNYLEAFEAQLKPTETLFRSVPADKLDWKPTENSFTLGQQMGHMAGALGVYAKGVATGEWGFASMRERLVQNRHTPSVTSQQAVELLQRSFGEFRNAVQGFSEADLAAEIPAPQFGTTAPRWRVLMLAFEHHISHKAEFFMCLKLLGERVNTATLYRG